MNTAKTILLPLDTVNGMPYFIAATDTTVSWGYSESGRTCINYSSCVLHAPPTEDELKAVGLLLMGGGDWGDTNCLLLALADQKTGQHLAGPYRAARAAELVADWPPRKCFAEPLPV
jgi:hypothetical protein